MKLLLKAFILSLSIILISTNESQARSKHHNNSNVTYKKGMRVNFDNMYSGRIVDVFSNNMVAIDSDYHSNTIVRSLKTIGVEVKCLNNLCTNDYVNFNSVYSGIAVALYSNGMVQIKSDYHSEDIFVNSKYVGYSLKCLDGICQRSTVVFNNIYTGFVTHVYSNGIVKIKSDYHSNDKFVSIQYVGAKINCLNNICSRDNILFDNKYTGNVVDVYDNGIVKINSDYHSSSIYRTLKSVGYSVRCYKSSRRTRCD